MPGITGCTLIVAHDSGGAEIVSAWVAAHPQMTFDFVLSGPAVQVFQRKLPELVFGAPDSLQHLMLRTDRLVTGTGWSSDLEKRAIELARATAKPVAAYLDHWVNYRERFQRDGRCILPDEIWVGDEFALRMARETFTDVHVVLQPNLYFEEMKQQVRRAEEKCARPPGLSILYVTEPLSVVAEMTHGNPRYWGYTEFDALAGYLDYLDAGATDVASAILRRHPSEAAGKYESVLNARDLRFAVEESSARTLAEDCARADWVVGCDSMAMVVAMMCGRRVFSAIPSTGPALTLPFPQIARLFPRAA